jgi:hypothetical protein
MRLGRPPARSPTSSVTPAPPSPRTSTWAAARRTRPRQQRSTRCLEGTTPDQKRRVSRRKVEIGEKVQTPDLQLWWG